MIAQIISVLGLVAMSYSFGYMRGQLDAWRDRERHEEKLRRIRLGLPIDI